MYCLNENEIMYIVRVETGNENASGSVLMQNNGDRIT